MEMTPQEIIDKLAEIEEAAFYGMHNPQDVKYKDWEELHYLVKKALIKWYWATGLKNR